MSERDVETVRLFLGGGSRVVLDFDEGKALKRQEALDALTRMAERERLLREALEFYANSSDNYMKAQAALAGMSFEEFRVLAATQEEGVR